EARKAGKQVGLTAGLSGHAVLTAVQPSERPLNTVSRPDQSDTDSPRRGLACSVERPVVHDAETDVDMTPVPAELQRRLVQACDVHGHSGTGRSPASSPSCSGAVLSWDSQPSSSITRLTWNRSSFPNRRYGYAFSNRPVCGVR